MPRRQGGSSRAGLRLIPALLTVEIPDTIVRLEECPDDLIPVVGQESSGGKIELGDDAIGPVGDQDCFAVRLGIAEGLRHEEILRLGDLAEFAAMF